MQTLPNVGEEGITTEQETGKEWNSIGLGISSHLDNTVGRPSIFLAVSGSLLQPDKPRVARPQSVPHGSPIFRWPAGQVAPGAG